MHTPFAGSRIGTWLARNYRRSRDDQVKAVTTKNEEEEGAPMAMKDDDYRMRDEREMSSRDRENSYRDREMNRDHNMGSRDWHDDNHHAHESNVHRSAPDHHSPDHHNSAYYEGVYNPGHYNQGSYQGAGAYGQSSYGNTYGGGAYGQHATAHGQHGTMPRSHYRDGSQTYPSREWNRDSSGGPTDYRSSPYEQDWGRSQWGNSEYGANFRDSSVLGNERTRYGRYGTDFQANGYGTSYAPAGGPYQPYHESMMHRVGRFFGVGPKGYKRSDARIEEDVNDALVDDPFIDATNVEVKVQDGEVTLAGIVDDRMAKRRAEDLAVNVRGVRDVHNHLRMVPIGHHHDIGTTTANTGLATQDTSTKSSRNNAVS